MFILTTNLNALNGDTGSVNPSARLAEIRSKVSDAEKRVRDLEALLTDLILNPDTQQDVDGNVAGTQVFIGQGGGTDQHGNITADASVVRQALYAARAYEGELRTAEQFWNQIVESNKQAEKDTHDLFKRA